MRSLGMTLAQTSVYYGGIVLVGGVAGIWLGGALSDRFGAANKAAYPLTPAACFVLALPFFLAAMNSSSPLVAFVLFVVGQALTQSWFGPVVNAVQHLVPPHMRTTANSLYLLVNSLLGTGVGYWIFGFLSDLLAPTYGAESMRYALYYGLAFYPLAALLLFGASRRIERDWVGVAG
jgi:MFS family permease